MAHEEPPVSGAGAVGSAAGAAGGTAAVGAAGGTAAVAAAGGTAAVGSAGDAAAVGSAAAGGTAAGAAGHTAAAAAAYEEAAALTEAYRETARTVRALDPAGLARPTRCAGWSVADLVFHQLLDAQRALVALSSPHPGPADRDAVSYWRAYPGEPESPLPPAHADFVRRGAAAYSSPAVLVAHLDETAGAAVRAAQAADPTATVTTQGYVLRVADLVATLVVEAVVHRLDLPVPVTTAPRAAAVTERTLTGLLGSSRPHGMAPDRFVLLATGRDRPDAEEAELLGAAAARLPVLS